MAALQTALYLTKTSTSTESDDGPTSKEAPLATVQSSIAHTEKTAPAETPTPNSPLPEIPSHTETTSLEAGLHASLTADASASPKATTSAVIASLSSSLPAQNAPAVLETANHMFPVISNPQAPPSLSTSPSILATPPASGPAPIAINGQNITPNAQSQYIIASQTLAPGSSITLGSGTSATLLALQTSSGSTALIYGPRPSLLPTPSGPSPLP